MSREKRCRSRNRDAMFDTIILLSSALEREIFMTVLSTHNPCLAIIPIESLADLNGLDPDTLASARLLAFVTGVIVPAMCSIGSATAPTIFIRDRRPIQVLRPRISRFTSAPPNSAPPRMSWPRGSTKVRSSAWRCFRFRRARPWPALRE